MKRRYIPFKCQIGMKHILGPMEAEMENGAATELGIEPVLRVLDA